MYRTIICGQEILIKLSFKLIKEVKDRGPIYNAVLSIAEDALTREEKNCFAIMDDTLGYIIGDIVRADVVVFSVEYVIDKQNLYHHPSFPRQVAN